MSLWNVPEGVRVLPDGTWQVGALTMQHAASLAWLKRDLVFGEQGAALVDGPQRLPVRVDGPAYHALELRAGHERLSIRV